MEDKARNILREIMLPLIGVILFPIFSIRAIMWNWFFWLNKASKKINEYKKQANKNSK